MRVHAIPAFLALVLVSGAIIGLSGARNEAADHRASPGPAFSPVNILANVLHYLVGDDGACSTTEILLDAGCWAATSGGPGSFGIPDSDDQMILDANSGSGSYTTGHDCGMGELIFEAAGLTAVPGFAGTIVVDFPGSGDCLEMTGVTTWASGTLHIVSYEYQSAGGIVVDGGTIVVETNAILGETNVGPSDLTINGGIVELHDGARFHAPFDHVLVNGGTLDIGLSGSFATVGLSDPGFDIRSPGVLSSGGLNVTDFKVTAFNPFGSGLTLHGFTAYSPATDSVEWSMDIGNDGDAVTVEIGGLNASATYHLVRDGSVDEDTSTSDSTGVVAFHFVGLDQLSHSYTLSGTLQAHASAPSETDVGIGITLTCTAMGGVPPYGFVWDLGDGGNASSDTVTHAYTSTGPKTAVCTVTDGLGNQAQSQVTIEVRPVLSATTGVILAIGVIVAAVAVVAVALYAGRRRRMKP
jgi:hypothetical protein